MFANVTMSSQYLLRDRLLNYDIIQMDETLVQVLNLQMRARYGTTSKVTVREMQSPLAQTSPRSV